MVTKIKINKLLIPIILLLIIYSCEYIDDTNKYKQLNSNAELDMTIHSVRVENGYILNEEYYCGGTNFLFENGNIPKWLLEKDKMKEIPTKTEFGDLYISINHMLPPYKILKKKYSNIMFVIKNEDTLKTIILY